MTNVSHFSVIKEKIGIQIPKQAIPPSQLMTGVKSAVAVAMFQQINCMIEAAKGEKEKKNTHHKHKPTEEKVSERAYDFKKNKHFMRD